MGEQSSAGAEGQAQSPFDGRRQEWRARRASVGRFARGGGGCHETESHVMAHKYRARLPSLLMMRSIPFSCTGRGRRRATYRDASVSTTRWPAHLGVQAVNTISTEDSRPCSQVPFAKRSSLLRQGARSTSALRDGSQCEDQREVSSAQGAPSWNTSSETA